MAYPTNLSACAEYFVSRSMCYLPLVIAVAIHLDNHARPKAGKQCWQFLYIVVFLFIGILAAIMVPSYQDYVIRSQQATIQE